MYIRKVIISFLLAISFLLPYRVEAYDLTSVPQIEYIDNYYFFEQPYNETNQYGTYENVQVNYGIFAPQTLGSNKGKFEIIPLKRDCKANDSNCYLFQSFWDNYKDIINNGRIIKKVGDNECNIAYKEYPKSNGKIFYYTHGCYREENSSEIKGTDKNNKIEYNSLLMACSSVSRKADVNLSSDDIYNYLELKIEREPLQYSSLIVHDTINQNSNISNCGFTNLNEVAPYTKYDNFPYHSPVLAKYSYTNTIYNCPNTKYSEKGSCNNSSSISQRCERKTIIATNARTDINIEQSGVITNILSPTKIYQGGGVFLGFIYQNTITWNYVGELFKEGMTDDAAKKIIAAEIEKTVIKPVDEFADELKNNVELYIDGISPGYLNQIKSNLQINCQRNGKINEGEKITTICTIFMPETKLNIGTGTINKVVNSSLEGMKYKVYTDITYSGKSHLNATISKLNMLKVDSDEDWSISFGDGNDTSCDIEIEDRLYNNGKYKFIYRPINIDNPFPNNRNAGVNWDGWWSISSNKDRLKNSYSKDSLQYKIELNPHSVQSIKNNTTSKDYYEWDENDETNNNKFIENNFDIFRKNIIESGDY